jgi:hypothetical protein
VLDSNFPAVPVSSYEPLSRWERRGVIALISIIVAFGFLVELRSAFLRRHMTDLGVYLRAGWAVRASADIYDIQDDNGWHYQYPPLFAILMAPLANPPPDVAWPGAVLPFAVSAAFWYAFSLGCLAFALHHLASALEETSVDPQHPVPAGCRRWWLLRLVPLLACIVPIGHTLMRGQVNLIMLALLCGMAAALIRGQSWRAGFWLSGAICLKVIPAFLLLVPLWRRDTKCLAASGLGMVLGLGVVPAAAFGVPRTVEYYREYADKLLLPGLGQGDDQSRAKELIEMTSSDSQSLLAMFHNTMNLDRDTRPAHPSEMARWGQRAVGGLLMLITLAAAGWRTSATGPAPALFLGALVVVMLVLSPICHLHYFCLCIPLLMALLALSWERQSAVRIGKWFGALLAVNVVADTLPNLPEMEVARDLGIATYAALVFWGLGCVALWKLARPESAIDSLWSASNLTLTRSLSVPRPVNS